MTDRPVHTDPAHACPALVGLPGILLLARVGLTPNSPRALALRMDKCE